MSSPIKFSFSSEQHTCPINRKWKLKMEMGPKKCMIISKKTMVYIFHYCGYSIAGLVVYKNVSKHVCSVCSIHLIFRLFKNCKLNWTNYQIIIEIRIQRSTKFLKHVNISKLHISQNFSCVLMLLR